MDAPLCLKCGSKDHMAVEDSGPTYTSWRCKMCDVGKTEKNVLGKTLPFLGLFLLVIGIDIAVD